MIAIVLLPLRMIVSVKIHNKIKSLDRFMRKKNLMSLIFLILMSIKDSLITLLDLLISQSLAFANAQKMRLKLRFFSMNLEEIPLIQNLMKSSSIIFLYLKTSKIHLFLEKTF